VRDEALAEQFARRDGAAYETAYERFRPRMFAAAMRILQDAEAASECVQDVFLNLWRRENAYSALRGSLEAFLVTCARNRALMRIRSSDRAARTAQKLPAPDEYLMEDDPIERERINRALSRLSNGQEAVVQLAYYRGMTLSEVAAELAIPIGTVKGRLSSALRALRRALIPETNHGL
jgi:RNA polymerase sigma-70 factor, ECF subfamily